MTTTRKIHIATIAVYLAIALLVRSTSRGAEIGSVAYVDISKTEWMFRITPQPVTIRSGFATSIKVGEARLTKTGVLRLIETLETSALILQWQKEDLEASIASAPNVASVARKKNIAIIADTQKSIATQLGELKKLEDALVEVWP
jgi:hypothetical protein